MEGEINKVIEIDLPTDDVRVANHYRHALSYIEAYAITGVIFDPNNTCRPPEYIANRMGQIPVDQERFDSSVLTYPFEAVGPGKFTSEHIIGLPTKFPVPIFDLGAGENLSGEVILEKGTSAEHARWKVFSTAVPFIRPETGKYALRVTSVGMYNEDNIREKLFQSLQKAVNDKPFSQYWYLSGTQLSKTPAKRNVSGSR